MSKIIKKILGLIKSSLPPSWLFWIRPVGHGVKAWLASTYYGFPGKKLKILAITGTKGKTSSSIYTYRILKKLGYKTGILSSAIIDTGNGEYINPYKMSTLDAIVTQNLAKEMMQNGLEYLVLEITSIGLWQNRHLGLGKFESSLFTNFYPEHLETHGSLENYLRAKSKIYAATRLGGLLAFNGSKQQSEPMEKALETVNSGQYKLLPLDYTKLKIREIDGLWDLKLELDNHLFSTGVIAEFEVWNLWMVWRWLAVYLQLDISLEEVLEIEKSLPGRMDWVVRDQPVEIDIFKFTYSILVDYAHEPKSMQELLETTLRWKQKGLVDKVIHVLSCDGAGRDDWKKPVMAKLSYELADYTVLTTDNYDENDDPEEILQMQEAGILDLLGKVDQEGKKLKPHYTKEIDRYQAFVSAMQIPTKHFQPGSRVLLVSTGVGVEYGLTQPTGTKKWDEKKAWQKTLGEVVDNS